VIASQILELSRTHPTNLPCGVNFPKKLKIHRARFYRFPVCFRIITRSPDSHPQDVFLPVQKPQIKKNYQTCFRKLRGDKFRPEIVNARFFFVMKEDIYRRNIRRRNLGGRRGGCALLRRHFPDQIQLESA
jgi:hypothetical protein